MIIMFHVCFTGQFIDAYRERLWGVLRKGRRSRRYLTKLCSYSAWRPVYHRMRSGADVNAPDPEGLTPLAAALESSAEPYNHFFVSPGWLGGIWPKSLWKCRLDDQIRDVLLRDPKYMFPWLPSRRVTDKDCIVELLLRAGTNPNILTKDRGDNCHWIWSNIFKHYNYPHPFVLALILANADVGCHVPIHHREECRIQGNVSLFDYAMFVCKGRLNSFKKGIGSSMFSCKMPQCSFQILQSSIRCLYLLVAAGANVSSDHIDAMKDIQCELHAIAATGKLSQTDTSTGDQDDLLVAISYLGTICQLALSPRTLADMCRLCLRAALRTYNDTGLVPHRGGWRLGLSNVLRRGYSPYNCPRTPTEAFRQRLSRLKLPRICKEFSRLGELTALCEKFNDWFHMLGEVCGKII